MRAFEVWLVISVAETIHGAARMALLQPLVGDFRARQISVFTGSLIILAIAVFFRNWLPVIERSAAALTGFFWVALTVAFEVILGRLVMGLSWERILEDYDVLNGGLMVLGLLVMMAAPFAALWYKRAESEKVSTSKDGTVRA
jgi:hypothetical protein